jgi:hypothetical protein
MPFTAPVAVRDRLIEAVRSARPGLGSLIHAAVARPDLGTGDLLFLLNITARGLALADRGAAFTAIVRHPRASADVWRAAYERCDPLEREAVVDAIAARPAAWRDASVRRCLVQWDAGRLAADAGFQAQHLTFPVADARQVFNTLRAIGDPVALTLLQAQGRQALSYLDARALAHLGQSRHAELRVVAGQLATVPPESVTSARRPRARTAATGLARARGRCTAPRAPVLHATR